MDNFLGALLFLIPILIILARRRKKSPPRNIPPGSLGVPIIGQTRSFVSAIKTNTLGPLLLDRANKYGPVSMLRVFGRNTVFIYGQAANKFFFLKGAEALSSQQPSSFNSLMGKRHIFELIGEDHKRMRGALVSFMKPDSLKPYVGKIDGEVRRHLQMHWEGKKYVKVLPLMNTLTFNIICSLLFGVEQGTRRDELANLFRTLMKGFLSAPIKIPFSTYGRSLRASAKIRVILKEVIREKKLQLQDQGNFSHQDLITYLISFNENKDEEVISDDEIVDNIMLVMIAGHGTSSNLITFIIRHLASDATTFSGVLQEQEDIAKSKPSGESLTWEDVNKMKYTWKVALETLRFFPTMFGFFRKALRDIEYEGYIIPEGWHVLLLKSMTHMDENIFEEPSKFNPERFDNQAGIPPYCFTAFGVGPRSCPRNELARIETLVAIHYLVTRFTWKSSCKDNTITWTPFPVPA